MKRALSGSLGQEISRTFQLCVLSWLLWLGWIRMFCPMFDLKILPAARWRFLLQDTSQVFSLGCWIVWNMLLAMEGNCTTCTLLSFLLEWNPVLSCSVLYLCCYDHSTILIDHLFFPTLNFGVLNLPLEYLHAETVLPLCAVDSIWHQSEDW